MPVLVAVAASTYAALTLLVVLFQLALAAGAPWGELAMAGRYPGKFPPAMRLAAIVQALLLVLMAAIVLQRGNLLSWLSMTPPDWAIWLVVTVNGLSLLMNLATPSKRERQLWAPVAGLLLLSALLVAISS